MLDFDFEATISIDDFEQAFDRILVDYVLLRPAMWAGTVNYDVVCGFVTGMLIAFQVTGKGPSIHDWGFAAFLKKRFSAPSTIPWHRVYTFPENFSEQDKIDRLRQDLSDYLNPLIRLAV